MLISVDTGSRGCGVGIFKGGEVADARYVRSSLKKGGKLEEIVRHMVDAVGAHVRTLVPVWQEVTLAIEVMQAYTACRQKGDQNDLITLSLIGGMLAGHLGCDRLILYKPSEWKGQLPPEKCARRVISRLSPEELARVQFKDYGAAIVSKDRGVDHNTIDAIGIGLKALGRFEPRKGRT